MNFSTFLVLLPCFCFCFASEGIAFDVRLISEGLKESIQILELSEELKIGDNETTNWNKNASFEGTLGYIHSKPDLY